MRPIVITGLTLAAIAALAALSSGLGYRWEIWTLSSAFTVLRWSAYTGLAAGAVSLVAATLALRRRDRDSREQRNQREKCSEAKGKPARRN